jgi:deferrochelatase/peroxidase EfeB
MKLGLGDGVSEYLQHTGSALFAIPPGIAQGEYVGQSLFA